MSQVNFTKEESKYLWDAMMPIVVEGMVEIDTRIERFKERKENNDPVGYKAPTWDDHIEYDERQRDFIITLLGKIMILDEEEA